MQIILSKYAGFCNGVSRSIEIAERTLANNNEVYCLHSLIHNKNVTNALKNKGLLLVKEDMLKTGDNIIISAHGAPKEQINSLKSRGINVIDATCPFVTNVHQKVSEYSDNGYEIIIFGDKQHAEIIATSGYCTHFQVVNSPEEIDFSTAEKYFIITQTTFDTNIISKFKEKIDFLSKKIEKTVVFFDSICYTTLWRQIEANDIAKKADIMLVIGDKDSSNTNKLYDICSSICPKTYFIQNVSDLKSVQIKKENNAILGIVSGASTPKELIMEVFYIMSEVNTTEQVVNEVVTNEVNEESTMSMADAMKKYGGKPKNYREGMHCTTTVVSADATGISVVIENGGKNDSGFIAKEEAEIDGSYNPSNYNPGDEIKCIIIPKEVGAKGSYINMSKKLFDLEKLDDERVQNILKGEEFTMSNMQEVKGGLLGKIGTYTIFVPASQIRSGFVKNLSDYTNKTLRLVALPAKEELDEEGNPKKRNTKRIVASQRVILEKEKAEKDEEFWSKIYEGAIVNGKVKRFASFGAFVSLKHMDALVHSTDLSWSKKRVIDPAEVLEINKNYDFIVLSADRESGKISLGYKQLQKKPYEIAQEKYPVGTIATGKVARIVSFGAFIELEPGIDGLVHVSQIKHGWTDNAAESLVEGQEVQVKVMKYEDDKITLSIKALIKEEPVEEPVQDKETAEVAPRNKKEGKFKKVKEVKEEDNEPREYVSENKGVTLGDLFANINLND